MSTPKNCPSKTVISRQVLLLAMALATGTACTHKDDNGPSSQGGRGEVRYGDFEKSVREIYGQDNAESCDENNAEKVLEIAKYLDENQSGFGQLSDPSDTAADSQINWEKVRIGDFYLLKQIKASTTIEADQYIKEDPWGWSDVYASFLELKENPTRGKAFSVLSQFQSLLVDDEDRIGNKINPGLDHRAIAYLPQYLERVESCLVNSQCLLPNLTPELAAWSEGIPYYKYYTDNMKKWRLDPEKSREQMAKLRKWVKFDLEGVSFHKNESIGKIENGKLIVPLRRGNLGEAAALLEPYLTGTWKEAGLDLQIDWKSEDLINIYQILFDKLSSGRATVSPRKKTMKLFNRNRVTSVAHEFGHILGLPDEYFTIWDEKTCKYTYESNPANIMSVSSRGHVMPHHIEALRAGYRQELQ